MRRLLTTAFATASLLFRLVASDASAAPATTPGTITEYPIPTAASLPFGITTGSDRNLWFGENRAHQVGRITLTGSFMEFPVPSGASLDTLGPDGNVWYSTDATANTIGRITQAGVATEFAMPSGSLGPGGITAGPDGNLWFAVFFSGQIGRVTTGGTFTMFSDASEPEEITAGPDGNLWFTDVQGIRGAVGRITTSGAVTLYETPTPLSFPVGITSGPDGNLWFVERNGNKIGRITTSGTITEFPLPTPGSFPLDITAGPDGNLWFTENGGNKIGRITPAGSITEFLIPTPASGPYGITTGPDEAIWFVEQDGNKIGRITTGCREADANGDLHSDNAGKASFSMDRDHCEDQDTDGLHLHDGNTNFQSVQIVSALYNDVDQSLTLTGTGFDNSTPVTFTAVAVNGLAGVGSFSLTLSDGYSISGTLLDGEVSLN